MAIGYYIDGWMHGISYFLCVGHFTESEWKRMEDGDVICKNGHEFWMVDFEKGER